MIFFGGPHAAGAGAYEAERLRERQGAACEIGVTSAVAPTEKSDTIWPLNLGTQFYSDGEVAQWQ